MKSVGPFSALGLALILCLSLAACGGGSSRPSTGNAPIIGSATLPPGAVNVPYSSGLGVVKGTGTPPFTWSITQGSLPPGLTLNTSTSGITGTPTTIGNFSFTIKVIDAAGLSASEIVSINIKGAISINPVSLPGGQVSVPYSGTLSATGGVLPYTWSVASGSLPAGLTLTTNPDGTATISGTPTTLGKATFTVQVADAESPPATATSGSLSITIIGFVTITTTSLPAGYVGIFYDAQLMATGGTAPYTWSLTSGTLPPGLSLTASTGVISGTPTTTGSFPITVQVSDSENPQVTATAAFTITINPTPALQVTTSTLPAGANGTYYTDTLTATGGIPPYSWSLTAGSMPLPAGLTLSGTGIIAGTPTVNGSFPITVQVSDTADTTASADLTLTIAAGGLTVTTIALPAGTVSEPYSATLGAAGGTPPYAWTILGTLPAGLTLDPSTGVITGTPTAAGTSPIHVQVRDSASPPGMADSKPIALIISPGLTNAALTGDFAFSFSGFNSGTPVVMAGRFTADGSGTISNGLLDSNSAGSPPVSSVTFTGTYSITANGLGTMTFNPSQGPPLVFAVAVYSSGGGQLIQSDPSNPMAYGSGAIKAQTLVTLAGGSFSFGATGVDLQGARFASAGAFQINASGTLTSGVIDTNDAGQLNPAAFLTGAYTTADPATGRGTASLKVNGGTAQNFSYYQVSSTEIIQVSADQVSDTSPLTLTSVLRQVAAGAGFTNVSLKGVGILRASGVNPNAGSPEAVGVAGLLNGDGTTDGNGFGNVSLLYDQNTNGTLMQQQIAGGQYKVNPLNGRVTIMNGFGGTPPVLYMVNVKQAFVLGTDSNATAGLLAPQISGTTGVPISNASVIGNYVGGSVTPALPAVTNQVDWLLADGNGNISIAQDSSGPSGPQSNQFAVTYLVDATGRALLDSNPGGTLQGILYMVSPTSVVVLSNGANPVLSTFASGTASN